MSKPAPFEDSQVNAILSRISKRAAQTVRQAAAESRARGDVAPGSPAGAASPGTPKPTAALLKPAGPRPYGRRRSDPPRTTPETRTLNEHAVALLQILPPQLRLVALRGSFPRIVNHVAAVWDDAKAFDSYIESLLIDKRGKRQGFPFPVVAELTELRTYHLRHVRSGGGKPD